MTHQDTGQQPTQQPFAPQGPGAYQSPGGTPSGADAPGGGPGAMPPQPPRKSWFARHKFLTALLAIIALVIVVNVFNGGEDEPASGSAPAEDAADTATEAPEEPGADGEAAQDDAAAEAGPAAADEAAAEEPAAADAEAGMGEAVRDGKFEFTVTEVETGVAEIGDEFLNEQAQGQFALVHVTVGNIGDEAQMFHGDNHTLVDDQGREHSANSSAAIYLDNSEAFLTDVNPGNSVDAIVVFDIPADAEPAAIELHDSMFSGGVTVSLTD